MYERRLVVRQYGGHDVGWMVSACMAVWWAPRGQRGVTHARTADIVGYICRILWNIGDTKGQWMEDKSWPRSRSLARQ